MIIAFQGRYDSGVIVHVDLSAIIIMSFDEDDFEVDMASTTANTEDTIIEVNIIPEHADETPGEAKARVLKLWNISRRRT